MRRVPVSQVVYKCQSFSIMSCCFFIKHITALFTFFPEFLICILHSENPFFEDCFLVGLLVKDIRIQLRFEAHLQLVA